MKSFTHYATLLPAVILKEFNASVSQNKSAVITLATSETLHPGVRCDIDVSLTYEYEGRECLLPAFHIEMTPEIGPELPSLSWSPYIRRRAIRPDEIEGHFFGRDKEEAFLLSSLRNGLNSAIYIEGIRRSGKTSLFNALQYRINQQAIPVIPAYIDLSLQMAGIQHVGQILYNIVEEVVALLHKSSIEVTPPNPKDFIENMSSAYRKFKNDVADSLTDHRLLILLDDFPKLLDRAKNASLTGDVKLHQGIRDLLDTIKSDCTSAHAKIIWIMAGHIAKMRFRELLGGVYLWAQLEPVPIDFLNTAAVGQILTSPLTGTNMVVPSETVTRVHEHTCGYPEVVQQMGEYMLYRALSEGRNVLTPDDADIQAKAIADGDDAFDDTWFPMDRLVLSDLPLLPFVSALVNATQPGETVQPHLLGPDGKLTDKQNEARRELIALKIFREETDGGIGIKAYILDRWIRRVLNKRMGGFQGLVSIFIDVANLTSGNGYTVLDGFDLSIGDAGRGRFQLSTIMDRILAYAQKISPVPISPNHKWAINYPVNCPAVFTINEKDFRLLHIPDERMKKARREKGEKGVDDITLRDKITTFVPLYPALTDYVIVTGDIDFSATLLNLLSEGKRVHFISRRESKSRYYDAIQREYPLQIRVYDLEELMTTGI